MSISIIITLEAISEFHEPKPYEHHASIRVDVYRGEKIADNTHVYHRCEDIKGESTFDNDGDATFDNEADAIAAARVWMADKTNTDKIIQEIITVIGE